MTNLRIDWDKLRVFKAVAEIGSMTSAAARLKESPPTVSRKIDELEEFLNSKLFTRSTRGVELTETGKVVLRYAQLMEDAANEVLSQAIGKSSGLEGRIRIGTGDGVGPYWIAPRLKEFQQAHPSAQVRMHIDEREPDLLNDEADISIQFTEPRDPEIISHKLGTLHYIGFASQEYLNSRDSQPSSLFEYHHHRCILHDMSEVAPIQFWMAYTEQTRRSPLGNLMIEWIKGLFDKQAAPWFTDDFIHPKQVAKLRPQTGGSAARVTAF
jgi:DNA-binding transcriptional LysR family regulator